MITLIGIQYEFLGMKYYQTEKDISVGDLVVTTTDHGNYIGQVKKLRKPTEDELARPDFTELFPPIIRIADFKDKKFFDTANDREKEISRRTQEQANELKLDMKILRSYLDIDEPKVLITFTAEGRVDFRELVRILNGIFHLRIELRQIGPRDQAKIVGGIGPCGLPLCCSTFLSTFDGISISMAKNQLLAINIPKLSGQCGKLMCCLKYEDKAYAEKRPLFPKIGEKFTYANKQYEVTGLNLLTDTITTYNGDAYESFSKEEFDRVKKGLSKVDESKIPQFKDVNSGVDLSGHGIADTANRIAQIDRKEKQHSEDLKNRNNSRNQNSRNSNKSGHSNNNRGNNNNSRNNNNGNNNRNNNTNRPNSQHNNNQRNNHNNRPNNNNNRNFHNSHNQHNNNKPASKKDSGFIPVSQIADKSVLGVKPVNKKDDQK